MAPAVGTHMRTRTTIVFKNVVAEHLVDERSAAEGVERMVRELQTAPRSKSRLRVLRRLAGPVRVAPRPLLVQVSQAAGSAASVTRR